MKYHVKPVVVVVEAVQWTGTNVQEVVEFLTRVISADNGLRTVRLEYTDGASPTLTVGQLRHDGAAVLTVVGGDWVVCGPDGKVVAVDPDVFAATYEPEVA